MRGFRVGVGAVLQQQFHHFAVVIARRQHQSGFAMPLFLRIDFRAMIQQCLHRFRPSGFAGQHQNSIARRQRGVGVCTGFQQQFHHGGVAVHSSFTQRSDAITIRDFCIRTCA